ncbi:MAG: type II toxin-antitoxin system VapC family toxin [Promethearchaeota archaeon]
MIILDTTACIDYLRGIPDIKQVLEKKNDIFAITSVTIYEVSIGLERTKRMKSSKIYHSQLAVWNKFRSLLKNFDLTEQAAEEGARIYDFLVQKGKIIDDNDILIAGIMRAMNITYIITRNLKHFQNIPGITVLPYLIID